ncbi:MAG: hypothetical protein EU536_00945 [Promethearchaeota archaeon]|nr:MAG: hypothetical protein EU536_00945 [Candidatus Lokiarchaeota archaeon]
MTLRRSTHYENYPLSTPLIAYLQAIAIYVIGTIILAGLGIWWAIFYIGYCIFIEMSILLRSCVHCFYYGKVCAFGRGRICAIFFKGGDQQKFAEREIRWYHLLPDFLVVIFPAVGGVLLLLLNFSWLILILTIVQLLVFFIGTAIIRGKLACNHCMQGKSGCPAAKALFKDKEKK